MRAGGEQHPILPTTRLGWCGVLLALIAVVLYIVLIAVEAREASAVPFMIALAAIVGSGAIELVAIIRSGERSILAAASLVPAALIIVVLLAEVTGLIE